MMEDTNEELMFGDRVLLIECHGVHSCDVHNSFLSFLKRYEQKIVEIMDAYDIPEEVVLRFIGGDETLDGIFHVQGKRESRHVIAIDIFTKHVGSSEVDYNLLDTFIHEMVHNKIKDEDETLKITKRLYEEVLRSG